MRKKERVIITVCALSIIILIGLAWFWLVPLVEQKNLEYKIIQADIAKYEEGIADLNKAKSLIDNAGTINGLPVTEEKILNTLPYFPGRCCLKIIGRPSFNKINIDKITITGDKATRRKTETIKSNNLFNIINSPNPEL